ncbi:Serine/threonine-protein kinase CDL1 [Hibiscus syriacus]|uniref:Serine/threonine-protein kinase CDL1 n=1 Tax=Hibiscus syriacus TaxID=106335 RepID=A0A6A3ALS1_HIBSY|nr:probable serine/threonine-protein kinase PBL7 [Hibiscus syriacus]KAE8705561.1 Serine/threonine-protein kinase CDL1 [Hibiscus syriacus]
MEDSKTTATEPSPAMSTPGLSTAKNHSHHLNHHHHHHFDSISRNNQHNTGLSFNSVVIIILSLVSVVVVFAIFVIIVMFRRLKSVGKGDTCIESGSINNSTRFTAHTTMNFDSSPDVKARCLYGGSVRTFQSRYKGVQVFTYKDLEQATDNFSEMNVIGNGRFGVVYRGVLADGTMAAIKRLHRDGKQGERAFRMEVDLLSRLNCPYLVRLLGYCADQQHRLLIYEFMVNGALQQHLHRPGNQHRPLDWGKRLVIALDCARALEFLHEHASPTVIHRDLKCSNILLDENLRAKVFGFGLAKTGSDKIDGQVLTRVLGTTGYLAPEYASKGKLTTKSDVYSYGVVLLQLLTGRVPIDINRPPGEHVLVSWALPRLTNRDKVDEMVDPAIQGQYTKKDLIQVAAIAAVCVQPEADYRPLMVDVVQSLIPLVKNFNSINSTASSRFL